MARVLPWTWSMRRRKIDKQDRLLSPRIFWWCLVQDVTSKDQCAETTPISTQEQCKQLWNAPACFELVGDWGESSSFWNMELISWIENVLGITSKPFSEKEEMNILAWVKSKWKNRMSYNQLQYVWYVWTPTDYEVLCTLRSTLPQRGALPAAAKEAVEPRRSNNMQRRATTANKCKQPQKISKAYERDKEKSILWFGQFNVTEDPLTSSSFFKV